MRPTKQSSWSLASDGIGNLLFARSSIKEAPGKSEMSCLASSSLNSFFKVKLMLSACARMTGTRMHVAAMVMSSVFQIFLVSFTIFISSSL